MSVQRTEGTRDRHGRIGPDDSLHVLEVLEAVNTADDTEEFRRALAQALLRQFGWADTEVIIRMDGTGACRVTVILNKEGGVTHRERAIIDWMNRLLGPVLARRLARWPRWVRALPR